MVDRKTQSVIIGGGLVLLAAYLLTSAGGSGLFSGGSQGGGGGGGGGGGVLADPQPVQSYDLPKTTFTPAPDKKTTSSTTTTTGAAITPASRPAMFFNLKDPANYTNAPRSVIAPSPVNGMVPSFTGPSVIDGGAVQGTKDVKKGLDAFQGSALSFLRR